MNKMINLVRNENMKLGRSISTWIMMGILLIILIGVALIIKFGSSQNADTDWRTTVEEQNIMYKQSLDQPGIPEVAIKTIQQDIQTNEYRLEHDIPPIGDRSVWGFVEGAASSLIILISLFAIIMGGKIVANEFSGGTIKLLLIRPAKRWKILLSKYIAVVGYTLLMLLGMLVFSFVIGGIFFSFKGANLPYLQNSSGVITEVSMVLYVVKLCALQCVNLIMMVTLAFMISTVTRNSGMAIGIGVFLLMAGNIITVLLAKYDWSKYILFANIDLNQYINGTPIVEGMTMTFSVIVLLVYFAIFNIISYLGFTKRDIIL